MIRAAIVLAILLVLGFVGSADAATDELIARATIGGIVLFLFPFVYAWYFVRTPAFLDAAQRDQIGVLEGKLVPKLRIILPPEGVKRIEFGTTMVSPLGGGRQSILRGVRDVIRLDCKNDGSTRLGYCTARIGRVMAVDDNGKEIDIGFRESVELHWSPHVEIQQTYADIDAGDYKSIYVLGVLPQGYVFYNEADYPIEYHQMLLQDRRYRLWVQVAGEADVGDRVTIDVWRDRETGDILVRRII